MALFMLLVYQTKKTSEEIFNHYAYTWRLRTMSFGTTFIGLVYMEVSIAPVQILWFNTSMIRAEYSSPDIPEHLKSASIHELSDSLLAAASRQEGTYPAHPLGYFPNRDPPDFATAVNLQPNYSRMYELENRLRSAGKLSTWVLKRELIVARKAVELPADAAPIYGSASSFYVQFHGPQIANEEEAFWSLGISRYTLTTGTTQEIPNTTTKEFRLFEQYLDDERQIKNAQGNLWTSDFEKNNNDVAWVYDSIRGALEKHGTLTQEELQKRLAYTAMRLIGNDA